MEENKIQNKILFEFLSYFLFLPSVTFSLIQAEIFPWAILFSLLFLNRIKEYILVFVSLAILSVLYGIFNSEDSILRESIRSMAAYLNPLLIFIVILKVDYFYVNNLVPKIKTILTAFLIIGILQYSNLFYFLDPVFKFLIPRGHAISLSYIGNRGVPILSSEPSRAAYEIIFIYLTFRTIYLKQKSHKFLTDIAMACYILFIIKSGVGLFILFVFFIVFYRLKFLFIASGAFLILISQNLSYSNRALSLLLSILSTNSFSELYKLLINSSGFRLISIISSFLYGLKNPFGGGIGNWQNSSIEALVLTRLNPKEISFFRQFHDSQWVSLRTTSYLFSLMLDIGIIGVSIFTSFFIKLIKKFNVKHSEYKNSVIFFLFYFLFVGSIGNPIPFICFAINLRYLNQTNPNAI